MNVPVSYLLLFALVYPLLVGLLLAIHVRFALAAHSGASVPDQRHQTQTTAGANGLPTNDLGRRTAASAATHVSPASRCSDGIPAGLAAWTTVTAPSTDAQEAKRRYTLCLN
jgi:hypothetical protein